MKWLYAKIAAAVAFITSILLYKRERRLRKEAIKDRERSEKALKLLSRNEEIRKEVDAELLIKTKENNSHFDSQHRELQEIIDEEDNRVVAAKLKRMLNKNRNRD